MKKVLPFLFAGMLAVFGVLFLLIRTDTVPSSIRSIHWPAAKPVEPEVAAE